MIWALLDAINNPEHYAVKIDREGVHLAPVDMLKGDRMTQTVIKRSGITVIGPAPVSGEIVEPSMTALIDQLYDIAMNEEFTPHQRKEQIAIALADDAKAVAAQHPTSLLIDEAIAKHMKKEPMPGGGIRISINEDGIPS